MQLLTARLADGRVAFRAAEVREIVRAVAIAPLPAAGQVVEGAINVRGTIVPVLDIRSRLGLPAKEVALDDHIVIAAAAGRTVAFRVDEVEDVADVPDAVVAAPLTLTTAARHIAGVAALPDGAVVIADLATFLSRWEAEAIDRAVAASGISS